MKRIAIISGIILVLCLFYIYASNNKYNNGIYTGISRSVYTQENFYGISKISIENGKISKVDFRIVDSANHELFDEAYEKHYIGNAEYIQQCRENWVYLQKLPDELIKSQDVEQIDGVSGATWALNIFKASVNEALKDAKK